MAGQNLSCESRAPASSVGWQQPTTTTDGGPMVKIKQTIHKIAGRFSIFVRAEWNSLIRPQIIRFRKFSLTFKTDTACYRPECKFKINFKRTFSLVILSKYLENHLTDSYPSANDATPSQGPINQGQAYF